MPAPFAAPPAAVHGAPPIAPRSAASIRFSQARSATSTSTNGGPIHGHHPAPSGSRRGPSALGGASARGGARGPKGSARSAAASAAAGTPARAGAAAGTGRPRGPPRSSTAAAAAAAATAAAAAAAAAAATTTAPPVHPPRAPSASLKALAAPACHGCRQPIQGTHLKACGHAYHPSHFQCTRCANVLSAACFYEHEHAPYCESCYSAQFLPTCRYCATAIWDQCITALEQTWHPDHFVCAQCGDRFQPGAGFLEHNGLPYCEADYFNLFAVACARCRCGIPGELVAAMGREWHPACFRCACCDAAFPDGVFYEVDGTPRCSAHRSGPTVADAADADRAVAAGAVVTTAG